jgi:hypothetical protein
MWKRKREAEWLPWYRARNYKGDLTEVEKRELDAFRVRPDHPAAQGDNLPEEVQSYLNKIELELYDKKQDGAVGRALVLSAIGAALLYLNYEGCFGAPTTWSYAAAVLLLVVPWLYYRYEWNRNAEEFLPSDAPHSATDEAIRQEWEVDYIARKRQAERSGPRLAASE